MTDMKETFKSEMAKVCREVKAVADRVEMAEEAQESSR